ncbi:MAG: MinD/ParA family protein [Candidatus Cloacimonetes bacterium]|nr:MinD/ParA family protein [Candidatus Cloacimonadota bacterium]
MKYSQSDELINFTTKSKKVVKTAQLISITSGKGGVGKSNLLLNLAIAMSIRGKKVLIIDADMNLSNIDILIGIYPEYTLKNLLDNLITIDKLLIEGPKGIKILPASSGDLKVQQNIKRVQRALIQAYMELKKDFDYILIDTGAGISDYTVDFVVNSDKILIVTTPEPTAITDAYAMIKLLHYRMKSPDISVIINLAQTEDEGKKIFNKINLIVQHFLNKSLKFAGTVPIDPNMSEAVKEQTPIIIKRPRSIASTSIHNLALNILKEEEE